MENEKNKGVSVSIGGNVNDSQVIASSGNINITSNQTNNSQNLIHQEFKVVYQKIEERDPVSNVDKSKWFQSSKILKPKSAAKTKLILQS